MSFSAFGAGVGTTSGRGAILRLGCSLEGVPGIVIVSGFEGVWAGLFSLTGGSSGISGSSSGASSGASSPPFICPCFKRSFILSLIR